MSTLDTSAAARENLGISGQFSPSWYGYHAWSLAPEECSTVITLVAGRLYLQGLRIEEPVAATAVDYYVTAVATSPTANQCLVGFYDPDGARITSAGTSFDTTDRQTLTLTPTTLSPGLYRFAFLFNGTTGPQIPRGAGATGGPGLANINLSASSYRAAYHGDANTALPDPIDYSTATAYVPLFCAIR